MTPLWWFEGFNLLLSIVGAVICLAAAAFFFVAFQFEKKTFTLWRPFGFLLLAIVFMVQALSALAVPSADMLAAILELCAFFLIYHGVFSEPIISHLRQVASLSERTAALPAEALAKAGRRPRGTSLLLFVATLTFAVLVAGPYMLSIISLLTAAWMALTIRLQLKRYLWEQDSPDIKRQNLYPLLAYVFLVGRAVAFALYFAVGAPRPLAVSAYVLMLAASALGLYFLARWVWIFIRVRSFLRHSFVSLVFLTLSWLIGILLIIPLIIGGIIYVLSAVSL